MCDKMTTQYIEKGFSGKLVPIKCGNTLINGGRAICEDCASDPSRMKEIERQERNAAADNAWAHSAGYGDY